MRAIKFRAWDKCKKVMVMPHDGDFIKWHAPSNWQDCYEVMQFTGLLDREGREIYEGDIISRFGDTQRTVVEFDFGCFVSTIRLSGGSEPCLEILCNDLSVTTIIGNIFENPELMR